MSLLSLERVCAHMFRQLAGFSWKINIQSRPKRFCYFYHLRWCCCALLRLNTRCVCMWSARWDRILCLGPSLKGIAFSIASAAASTIVKQDVCPKFLGCLRDGCIGFYQTQMKRNGCTLPHIVEDDGEGARSYSHRVISHGCASARVRDHKIMSATQYSACETRLFYVPFDRGIGCCAALLCTNARRTEDVNGASAAVTNVIFRANALGNVCYFSIAASTVVPLFFALSLSLCISQWNWVKWYALWPASYRKRFICNEIKMYPLRPNQVLFWLMDVSHLLGWLN